MSSTIQLVERGLRNPTRIPTYLLRRIERPPLVELEPVYQLYLLMKGSSYNPSHPDLSGVGDKLRSNALQTPSEYNSAVKEVRSLGLHPHFFRAKNWDALSALKFILSNTGPSQSVLDAGGTLYSPLVEWLYLYGYRDLCVCNIEFDAHFRRGPIEYRSADFVDREFEEDRFDVVTSLSVIEHGLDIRTTLEEFHRIIKPNGFLILSTDYWEEKVDTEDEQTHYGEDVQRWNVFDREELGRVFEIAESIGYETPDDRDLSVEERTVEWKGRSYTFAYFELRV